MRSQILILSLHRVGYPPANATHRNLFTTPRLLTFLLRFLKLLGFRFATLKDGLSATDGKIAIITFDDGYEDNFTLGLPVLQKFNAPATVFVITGDVGARNLSWDEAGEKLPADFMSWNELKKLRECGWEIGSHAHSHIHLAEHPRRVQTDAITRSINEIKENLGETTVSFAYPYGSYDQVTLEVLDEAGIEAAVTIMPSTSRKHPLDENPLELSRVSIGGRNLHHYFKSMVRILRATGISSLLPVPKLAEPSSNSVAVTD